MKLCPKLLFIFPVVLGFSAQASPIMALSTGNQLLLIDSAAPGTVLRTVSVTGLQSGEVLHGIDYRPASGELYGLGSSNLYVLNTNTGFASPVVGGAFPATISGTSFGFDF